MRFFADECADRRVLRALRDAGHEVELSAPDAQGAPDEFVLARSNVLGGVLVTADKDFGALIFGRGLKATGVVLLRSADPDRCTAAILDHLAQLEGAILVVSDRSVRLRPLPETRP
ncbi:MAG: DUF5615 family PIN-like protein [Oceanicaulis sp.]